MIGYWLFAVRPQDSRGDPTETHEHEGLGLSQDGTNILGFKGFWIARVPVKG